MTQMLFIVTLGGYITFSVAVLVGVLVWIFRNDTSAEKKQKRPVMQHNSVFVPNSQTPHSGPVSPIIGKSRVELDALSAATTTYVVKENTPAVEPTPPPAAPSQPDESMQADSTFAAGVDPFAARPMEVTPGVATILVIGTDDTATEAMMTDDLLGRRIEEMVAFVEKITSETDDEITLKDVYRLANDHQAAELTRGNQVSFEECFTVAVNQLELTGTQIAAFESSRQWLTSTTPTEEPISVLTTVVSLGDQGFAPDHAEDIPWNNNRSIGAFM